MAWTSMFWSIETCQYKVSADQHHVTISRAQKSRSAEFFKVAADQVLGFDWSADSSQINLLKH